MTVEAIKAEEAARWWQWLSRKATLPARRKLFARTAESLRLEARTGRWHCVDHLVAECKGEEAVRRFT